MSASVHVLEVHLPSGREPLLFLAEPLGLPSEAGFPLRLKPMADAPKRAAPSTRPDTGAVRGRRPDNLTLTASHTADLSQVGPLPAPPEDPLLGRALAGGKLKIEALIGQGGVGAVYKARHRELRMNVAVKVLHESFQQDIDFCRRFYAEALAASRLDHPNITRVIDFGQEPDGLLYFAMEFLDGVELRHILDAERVLPAKRIAELMMQTCAGLSHAHARGIVHRDIKPENLVLVRGQDDDGKPIDIVKVCDFGIAQQRALAASDQGGISGTPEYMSPEQSRGDELDARSDVYAVGVVLYELATGQVPFAGEKAQSILNKHQFTPPMAPSKIYPKVDRALEAIVMRALAKEPENRQQDMRALRAELRALLTPSRPAMPSVREPVARAAAPDVPPAEEAPPSRAPEWLERGPVYAAATKAASTPQPPGAQKDELADAIARDAAGWIQRFASSPDERAVLHVAQRLDQAIRTLAARGDTRALWTVSSGLATLSMDAASSSRANLAGRVVRVFEDPNVLAVVAEQLLTGAEDTRDFAKRILVNAGVAGAYGLYGARVKLASDQAIRAPFLATLKDFGPKAWPVVRAALEKILAMREATVPTMELAEDLLLCVPTIGDESAGHVVVKYLRANVSGVCRAATAAIVKLWGERSKPLLVGMLQSKDDVVRIAGIAGLRQLSGIDEHVVPRLHAILTRRIAAGDELRAAAAVALAHATPSARQPAVSLLAQLVAPARDGSADLRTTQNGVLSREDAVVIAVARSLLAVGGKGYRGLVAERADRSVEPLKGQLRRLLA